MDVIVGTAGHIDHGKTALVRALTGIDADRLPEEKRRGITIDLGFAEMSVGETHFGFVDVPGHEKFVRNMLAGASGIDIVLLVIAADEGVMPQTREHFDICRLLGIKSGIIVLTKSDMVDAETLELATLEAGELVVGSFLENSEIVEVSSKTGSGIEELKNALIRAGDSLSRQQHQSVTRLNVDRSFSIKGFGAVVTGTLAAGQIADGTEMELLPEGKRVRVRGLQTHNRPVATANSGQRVAVNLGGISHTAVIRGMTLAKPDVLRPTQIVNAEIAVLQSSSRWIKTRQRIRLHIGTAEVLGRVQVLNDSGEIAAGEKDFTQIRLETPIVAIPGERFIIRRYSPQTTIGGGQIADTFAEKSRRKDFAATREWLAQFLAAEDDAARLRLLLKRAASRGMSFTDLQASTALKTSTLLHAIGDCIFDGSVIDLDGRYIDSTAFEILADSVLHAVTDFHNREPLSKGMALERLRDTGFSHHADEIARAVFRALENQGKIVIERETARIAGRKVDLSQIEAAFIENIGSLYNEAGLNVPRLDEVIAAARTSFSLDERTVQKLLRLLLDSGEIIKVTDEFYFGRGVLDELKARVKKYASTGSDRLIDVAAFKDIAGVSRKFAIPLLEYFDREKITARHGDKRVIL